MLVVVTAQQMQECQGVDAGLVQTGQVHSPEQAIPGLGRNNSRLNTLDGRSFFATRYFFVAVRGFEKCWSCVQKIGYCAATHTSRINGYQLGYKKRVQMSNP